MGRGTSDRGVGGRISTLLALFLLFLNLESCEYITYFTLIY